MKQSEQLIVNSIRLTVRSGFSTLLIIVFVAIVGVMAVLAFSFLDVSKKTEVTTGPAEMDQQIKQLQTLSTSDEVPDIEKDLSSTNIDSLDSDLTDVDKDLGNL